MKKWVICILFIILAGPGYARKIGVLPEIVKPDMLAFDKDVFYVTQGAEIFIYSRKDYSLVKKFGQQGEGPKEFKISPFGVPLVVFPEENHLFISSDSKVSYFSKGGEFIKEFKVRPYLVFRPFKDIFVGTANTTNQDGKMVITVILYNEKFERIGELYQSDIQVGPSATFNYPMNSFSFEVMGDRVYVAAGKEGFVINIFDKEGQKINQIKKPWDKIPVGDDYRRKTLEWFKINPNFKQFWDFFKTRITFKEYYPTIQDMKVTDNRIYVLTYRREKDNTECIILDPAGKELKKIWVSIPVLYGEDFLPKYDIYDKVLYTLWENEEEEVWELHQTSVR